MLFLALLSSLVLPINLYYNIIITNFNAKLLYILILDL